MRVRLEGSILRAAAGFSACWIETGEYPLAHEFRSKYAGPFLRSVQAIFSKLELKPECYLQVSFLHHQDQWIPLQQSAAKLMPKQGLGVHPDDPPHQFTTADLEALDPRKPFKSFIDVVLQMSKADLPSLPEAFAPHWGLGSTMFLGVNPAKQDAMDVMSRETCGFIQDPSFRIFPFYVPLLHGQNFGMVGTDPRLQAALDGLEFYCREAPPQHGIFLLAAGSISDVLDRAGLLGRGSDQHRLQLELAD